MLPLLARDKYFFSHFALMINVGGKCISGWHTFTPNSAAESMVAMYITVAKAGWAWALLVKYAITLLKRVLKF